MNLFSKLSKVVLLALVCAMATCPFAVLAANYGDVGLISNAYVGSDEELKSETVFYETSFDSQSDVDAFKQFGGTTTNTGVVFNETNKCLDVTKAPWHTFAVPGVKVGDTVTVKFDGKICTASGNGASILASNVSNADRGTSGIVYPQGRTNAWIHGLLGNGSTTDLSAVAYKTVEFDFVMTSTSVDANGNTYIRLQLNNQISLAQIDNFSIKVKGSKYVELYNNKLNSADLINSLKQITELTSDKITYDATDDAAKFEMVDAALYFPIEYLCAGDKLMISFDCKGSSKLSDGSTSNGARLFMSNGKEYKDPVPYDNGNVWVQSKVYTSDGSYKNCNFTFTAPDSLQDGSKKYLCLWLNSGADKNPNPAYLKNLKIIKVPADSEKIRTKQKVTSINVAKGNTVNIESEVYSNTGKSANGCVIVALYDQNNNLCTCDVKTFENNASKVSVVNNIFVPADATNNWKINLFAWDGFDEIVPYTDKYNLVNNELIVNGGFEVTDKDGGVYPKETYDKAAYGYGVVTTDTAYKGAHSLKMESKAASNGTGIVFYLLDDIKEAGTYKLSYWYKVDSESLDVKLVNNNPELGMWKTFDLKSSNNAWTLYEMEYEVTANADGTYKVAANNKTAESCTSLTQKIYAGGGEGVTTGATLYIDELSFKKVQ